MTHLQSSEAEMKVDNYILFRTTQIFPQYLVPYRWSVNPRSMTTSTWGIMILYVTFRYLATDKSTHLGIKLPVPNAIFTKKLFFLQC